MMTIQTRNSLLIQVHKNHVTSPMDTTCTLEFTGFNGSVVVVPASVQTLSNCYLLEAIGDNNLDKLGLNAGLKVLNENGDLVHQSRIQLFIPQL